MKDPTHIFPETFCTRLKTLYPKEYASILHAFSVEKPTTFRVNTLKADESQVVRELSDRGFDVRPVREIPLAYILRSQSLRKLTELALYTQGFIYVQSLSSMIPALILDPQPGEKILDLTAAPGSKTTQMAALMGNTGTIVANDNSRIRIYKLKANLLMQGVTNTVVTNQHGQIFWQSYPEYFDKTLVDAPCSMEGRFRIDDPKSYLHWSTHKVKELAERQRFLLRAAVSATKPGGVIVYSTCTLAPEENESVVDWIVKREKGAVDLLPIQDQRFDFAPTCMHWQTKRFDPRIAEAKRILPSETMEGFFIAKLIKIRSNVHAV